MAYHHNVILPSGRPGDPARRHHERMGKRDVAGGPAVSNGKAGDRLRKKVPPAQVALSPHAYRLLKERGLVYEEPVPHKLLRNAGLVVRGLAPAVPTDGTKNEHFFVSNSGVFDRRRHEVKDYNMPIPKFVDVHTSKELSHKLRTSKKEASSFEEKEVAYQDEQRKFLAKIEEDRLKEHEALKAHAIADLNLQGDGAKVIPTVHRAMIKHVETRANRDHLGSDVAPMTKADEFGVAPLHIIANREKLTHVGINFHQGVKHVDSDMAADHLGLGLGHMQPDEEHDMNMHMFGEMQSYGGAIRDAAHQLHRERRQISKQNSLPRPSSNHRKSEKRVGPSKKRGAKPPSGPAMVKGTACTSQENPERTSLYRTTVPSHVIPAHRLPARKPDRNARLVKIAVTPPWLSQSVGRDGGRFKRSLLLPTVHVHKA